MAYIGSQATKYGGETLLWVGTHDFLRIGVKKAGDIFYASCSDPKLKFSNLPLRVNNDFSPNINAPYGFGFHTTDLALPIDSNVPDIWISEGVILALSNSPILPETDKSVRYILPNGQNYITSPLNPPIWNVSTQGNENLVSASKPDLWQLGGYMFSFWHKTGIGKSVIKIKKSGIPSKLNLIITPGDRFYLNSNGYINCHIPFIVKHAAYEGDDIAIYTDSFVLPERWDGSQLKINTQDIMISNYAMRDSISDKIEYLLSDMNTKFICDYLRPVNITKYFEPRSDQYQEVFYIDCTGNDYDVSAITGKPNSRTPEIITFTPGWINVNSQIAIMPPEPITIINESQQPVIQILPTQPISTQSVKVTPEPVKTESKTIVEEIQKVVPDYTDPAPIYFEQVTEPEETIFPDAVTVPDSGSNKYATWLKYAVFAIIGILILKKILK